MESKELQAENSRCFLVNKIKYFPFSRCRHCVTSFYHCFMMQSSAIVIFSIILFVVSVNVSFPFIQRLSTVSAIISLIFLLVIINKRTDEMKQSEYSLNKTNEKLIAEIDTRSRIQQELSESQKQLKTIWDTVKAGIVIIDAQSHKIVDANPLALSMLSATKEEVLGATCHRLICPSDKGKCPITDLGNTMDNSERKLIAQDGNHIPILKTAVKTELNGKPHLLESFIDISPIKQVQAELEDQNSMLQQAHEHIVQREKKLKDAQSKLVLSEKMASLGVLISGIAHEINTPAGAIANVSIGLREKIKTIINQLINIHDLSHEELHLLGSLTEQFINGRFVAESGPQWKKRREIRKWLAESGVENDKDVVTILSKYNLLDKEQLAPYESLLKKQWAVNLMDAFGTVDVGMQICDSSIKKISEIVKALKHYAYTDMDKTSLVDINENIQNVLLLMQNKLKYSFDVEKKFQQLPRIHCTSEISQVWTNLISNAHDAVVESKNQDEKGKIGIETRAQDDWIKVQITDNGVGISPENSSKMFDPFYTTKEIGKGTGLGLSIVSGIIKKHNGQISAASIPGNTTFTVSLPIKNGNGAEIHGQ
jgi:PAS domain S-box-containing protein